ncbi:PLP-dependent transferase [Sinorhizobium alkalisoli]|uniref:PLP-dependent transferase n=1 Tax=Sinorhizobium alkalisoli TaxID=1752398 RepID=UPI0012A82F7A|nr:PLP-dependent transferase [Sinorhizobium alkalisoli]QFI70510.1 Methionine gamma-lyase [Sinorhizobium alkalisoli]
MLEALGRDGSGRKYTIFQIDAHIDWRDVHMGESYGLSSTMRRASEMNHVERIIQVGSRGIGSAETTDYEEAIKSGVKFITAYEYHKAEAVTNLIPQASNIVICIDADAFDPSIVPSVIGRSPGGLSYYQMVDLIKGAACKGKIAAMDFVMPERDVNSYTLPYDPSMKDWSDAANLSYTRNSGHNQICLQRKLAAIEGGEDAAVFSTGVAALHGIFFTFLKSGDHGIVGDVTYEAAWRLFAELLPQRYNIEATFADMSDMAAVRAAVRPNAKLIHTESIANPTTKVADVAILADIAKGAGAMLSVNSTFTPPPFFRPLELGADLVVHSLTKYIKGHGDAMGGVVIGPQGTYTSPQSGRPR